MSAFKAIFQPLHASIFSTLPFSYRWRILLLQPIVLISAILTSPYWLFTRKPPKTIHIPSRTGRPMRALLYIPSDHTLPSKSGSSDSNRPKASRLRPLHLDLHGGGFMAGQPEHTARWCAHLSSETGAVVVSTSYRLAPRYIFPAAIDDVDDVVSWLSAHAEEHLGADPKLMTIGGLSAGGNLALAGAEGWNRQRSGTSQDRVKGYVGFYAPIDLRLKPLEKPKPLNFPTWDPLFWALPLYDAYAGPARQQNLTNPRMNPIVADVDHLPEDMLFVVPTIDILVHEQLTFVHRVQKEIDEKKKKGEEAAVKRVEANVMEGAFHGFIELPAFFLEEKRQEAFAAAVDFLKETHRRHGFSVAIRDSSGDVR